MKYKVGIEINEIRFEEYEVEANSTDDAIGLARDCAPTPTLSTVIRTIKTPRKCEPKK